MKSEKFTKWEIEQAEKFLEMKKAELPTEDRNKDSTALVDSAELLCTTDRQGVTKIRQCAENVFRVIENDSAISGKIKADDFNHSIMYFGQLPWKVEGDVFGEWKESDDAELRNYLDIHYGLNTKTHYEDGFLISVSRNRFNPLTAYLDALEWDGVHRAETILPDYLGAEKSEYTAGVTHTFLQGMIHRAYNPGCKFDLMLILVGDQGIGKSTFFKYLACNDDWYDGNFNFRSTDSKSVVEHMTGKWVLEMGEMATLKKDSVSADAMKSFITNQSDVYRVPFAKRPENRKRQCVFCGTSNDINFLKDRTGNRRYLPIDVHIERATKNIFDEKTAREDFKQVIAEAVHYYKSHPDELPIMSESLVKLAEKMQAEHLEEDSWTTIIQDYLDNTQRSRVNALCLWVEAFNKDKADLRRAEIGRILTIMRKDIKGWHETGKGRCPDYGNGAACFERSSEFGNIVTGGTGFQVDEAAADFPF